MNHTQIDDLLLPALEAVDALWEQDALSFPEEMRLGSPVGKVWQLVRTALGKPASGYQRTPQQEEELSVMRSRGEL